MEDPMLIYEIFNRLEGAVWFGLAIGLPFYLRPRSKRQRYSVAAASSGLFCSGFQIFWRLHFVDSCRFGCGFIKIACAALILSCRFFYVGWHRFRLSDRYVLFALFCLIASIAVIYLQHQLYGSCV